MPKLDWDKAAQCHKALLRAVHNVSSFFRFHEHGMPCLFGISRSYECSKAIRDIDPLLCAVAEQENCKSMIRGMSAGWAELNAHQSLSFVVYYFLWRASDFMSALPVTKDEARNFLGCDNIEGDDAMGIVRTLFKADAEHIPYFWRHDHDFSRPDRNVLVLDVFSPYDGQFDEAACSGPNLFALFLDHEKFEEAWRREVPCDLHIGSRCAAAVREFAQAVERFAGRPDDDPVLTVLCPDCSALEVDDVPREGRRRRNMTTEEAEEALRKLLVSDPGIVENFSQRSVAERIGCAPATIAKSPLYQRLCQTQQKRPKMTTTDPSVLGRLVAEKRPGEASSRSVAMPR